MYLILKNIHDSDEDARRLVKLIKGIPAKINLIPFNEWPGSPFERSDWKQIESFAEIIYRAGYASPIRTPRGEDIMAACGQLKSATKKERKATTTNCFLKAIKFASKATVSYTHLTLPTNREV